MAYTLTRADGSSFVFPGDEWWYVLQLLEQYGWESSGTISPSPEGSWDGTYLAKRGQTVTAQDATAMASALEGALPDPAEDTATEGGQKPDTAADSKSNDPRAALRQVLRRSDPMQVMRGEARDRLHAFVEFARSGAFRIGE